MDTFQSQSYLTIRPELKNFAANPIASLGNEARRKQNRGRSAGYRE